MDINRLIRTDAEHAAALREIDTLMNAEAGTPEEDRLMHLVILVQAYESARWPIAPPDPVDAILFMMDQKNLTPAALVPAIGTAEQVEEVLGRRRPLTGPMIDALSWLLDLPASLLARPDPTEGAQ